MFSFRIAWFPTGNKIWNTLRRFGFSHPPWKINTWRKNSPIDELTEVIVDPSVSRSDLICILNAQVSYSVNKCTRSIRVFHDKITFTFYAWIYIKRFKIFQQKLPPSTTSWTQGIAHHQIQSWILIQIGHRGLKLKFVSCTISHLKNH